MRLVTKVSLTMAGVATVTAALSLPAAIVYTENRLDGLPRDVQAMVERQIELNAWDDFDGMLEFLVVAGVAAAAATVLGVVIARRIARPAVEVAEAAHRVAAGDLTARAPERAGTDELGRLVRDFNTMAGTIEGLERDRVVATAAIAHELRSPLTVLSARLQAADDGLLAVDDTEIGRLRRQVDTLTWLVDDLRTLSLGTAGRLVIEPQSVDLAALVDRILCDAEWAPGAPVHRLEGPAGVVSGDPVLLERAIVNIVGNAVRHARDGGSVTIAVGDVGDHVTVAVTNDGDPIGDDALPQLFEPFYRADPSRDRRSGGSGLGLTIVRMIVDAHGGEVRVENTDAGPRVTITLPGSRA